MSLAGKQRNRFRNNEKAIGIGNRFWNACEAAGLAGIVAAPDGSALVTPEGHRFLNLSCCSYLDLDRHPAVLAGAVEGIRRFGMLDHCIPRSRVQIPALIELEESLSDLFGAQAVSAISASVASAGILPLIASGHLSGGKRPVMLFDRHAHVSMASIKPACAEETEVVTVDHHDLDTVERFCRTREAVCYVCDGSDSLGGYAPVEALRALQGRFGLQVFYDDCHSISIRGERGQGYVLDRLGELDPLTIVVATLNKAFGTSGAALLLGGRHADELRIVERFAGAMAFSQPMNTAAIGASMASAALHRTPELETLQRRLADKIARFDALCPTPQAGSDYPIRLVPCAEEEVVRIARYVFAAGYYVSPVFFPIVPRGEAGLRVMLRAGLDEADIAGLAGAIASAHGGAEVPA